MREGRRSGGPLLFRPRHISKTTQSATVLQSRESMTGATSPQLMILPPLPDLIIALAWPATLLRPAMYGLHWASAAKKTLDSVDARWPLIEYFRNSLGEQLRVYVPNQTPTPLKRVRVIAYDLRRCNNRNG